MELHLKKEMTPEGNWNPQKEKRIRNSKYVGKYERLNIFLLFLFKRQKLFKAVIRTLYCWVYYKNIT